MKQLVKKANGEKEVTLAMIRRSARCKFSESTIQRCLQTRNIKFRKLRSKPVLTRSDKLKRFRFAKKYKGKSCKWWRTHIQLHIDNKGGKGRKWEGWGVVGAGLGRDPRPAGSITIFTMFLAI
jgi:hypothetical protein